MHKRSHDLSDRELLIRIDERTAILPELSKTVSRHDREILIGKVFVILLLILAAIKFPIIADAIGRILGG